jgi:hypothetical protein
VTSFIGVSWESEPQLAKATVVARTRGVRRSLGLFIFIVKVFGLIIIIIMIILLI